MSIRNMLVQTATVQMPVRTKNSIGAVQTSYLTRISGLPCSVLARNIAEVDQFGKDTIRNTYTMYVEYDGQTSLIGDGDRIMIGSETFEVKGRYNVAERSRLIQIGLLRVA